MSSSSVDAFPAATLAVAPQLLIVAAAVDDVRPRQVAEGCAEHVHQPGERPQREQSEGGEGVQLKPRWCLRHQGLVGVEGDERAVPDRYAFAVVVLATDR